MSLIVYDKYMVEDMGVEVIDDCAGFFDVFVKLPDDEYIKDVLDRLENVTRVSDMRFMSNIFKDWGSADISDLSTGCKTLLSIYQNPDKCFSLTDCGKNFRDEILTMDRGTIVWMMTYECALDRETKCDILYNDKRFVTVGEFLDGVQEVC